MDPNPNLWTHQVGIYATNADTRKEIEDYFPYRDGDWLWREGYQILIHLAGYLSKDQLKWLRLQKREGKIIRNYSGLLQTCRRV